MGTGTTEQTHRAPALLHTLWAILYRKTPLARGELHVDAGRSSPLTSPSSLGPHLVHRRQLPFHAHCSGRLLCHALISWCLSCDHISSLLGAGGFAKRCAQVPATWDKALPETKILGGFNLRISFPLAPGTAGPGRRSRYKCTKIVTMQCCSSRADQVAQQARSSIWPLSRALRPLHLPPKRPAAPLSAQIKSHHDCASSERDARE